MLTAPANWNALYDSRDSHMEMKVNLNGKEYFNESMAASDCKISHHLYDSLSIGKVCSAEFTVTLFDPDPIDDGIIPIDLYCRLTNSDRTIVTPWVPQGKFWVDTIDDDTDGSVGIVAYDTLMLAEQDYFKRGEASGSWPKKAPAVVNEICSKLGCELDSRSVIPDIDMPSPDYCTIREVLQQIATVSGGNWTMTKEGKLRLIPIGGNSTHASCEKISVGDIVVKSSEKAVTQVILKSSESSSYSSGNESGYTVEGSFPGADQELTDDTLSKVSGTKYHGFSMSDAYFSPLLELGDPISVEIEGITYYPVFDSYSCLYEEGCWGDIESPMDTSVNHRIRFSHTEPSQSSKAVKQAVSEAKQAAETTARQTIQDSGYKIESVSALPEVQEHNTLYLIQGSAG